MNMLPDDEDKDTEVDFDVEAAVADISSDLFGQGDEEKTDKSTEVGEEGQTATPTQDETPPQVEEKPEGEEPKPEENSEEVQAIGAPKTWSKDAIADWATIPDRAKQEILKREEDMFKGIEQYREKADLGTQYDKVVEPYRAVLAAENVNPVELFHNFAGNHYLLARGTPEQKTEVAARLFSHYGLDIDAVKAAMGEASLPVDPKVKQLQDRIAQLESGEKTRLEAAQTEQMKNFSKEVEEFSSPEAGNIYWNEVAADIPDLLRSGAAPTLQAAYDLAVLRNPTTRQREIDRLAAEKLKSARKADEERNAKAVKAQSADVTTSQKTRNGTVPVGSMDDTLEETLQAIAARG